MISVIVSSYKPELFSAFSDNLKATIGDIVFEIIRIKNPGIMGLAEAYNQGAAKAQYAYLCFVHEDVLFETKGWGQKLIDHFTNDKMLGLIGVAGSRYKSFVYSGLGSTWGNAGLRMNIIQTINGERQYIVRRGYNKNIEPVIVLDGCFLCTTVDVFSAIQFDENNFKGFHCYDIDFSLSVGMNYTVAVVYDMVLEHLSTGGFNKNWLDDTFTLHKKWKWLIPHSLQPLSKADVYAQEAGVWYFLLNKVMQLHYGYSYFSKINFSKKFIGLVGLKNWLWMQLKLPVNVVKFYTEVKQGHSNNIV